MKKFVLLFCFIIIILTCILPAGGENNGPIPGEEKAAAEPLHDEYYPFLAPGSEPVVTEYSYVSENVSIHITPRSVETPINKTTVYRSDVYIADIWIKNISSFRRAYSGEKWKTAKDKIGPISEANNAIISMSGDSSTGFSGGWVVINGEAVRSVKKRDIERNIKGDRDICIVYQNGVMAAVPVKEIDNRAVQEGIENGEIWQVFIFGPVLLDGEGHAMTKFHSDVKPANPRSAIGYYEPGHYCFVQVDGRQTMSKLEEKRRNRGLTLTELSSLMEELGCKAAYNLDGGRTSQMYFNGATLSTPEEGGRKLSDIVLIREPD